MSRPRPAEAALEGFFDSAAREHVAAIASVGEVERTLGVGDRRLRLRFAGAPLAHALTAALSPRLLEPDGIAADTTIGLWEERSAPGGAAPVPWRQGDIGPRGLVRGDRDAPVLAIHEAGSLAVTLLHRRSRALLHRVPGVASLPWWERAAPLRPALFWALSGAGRHLVHAGVVGDEQRGGVLLAGAGGSGKTTVALAALAAGMAYVGDDYVLLHTEAQPVAWNLFGTAKLDPGHVERFPALAAELAIPTDPVPDEKAVLDIARTMPDALVGSLPIRAVLMPRVRGGHARLRPASAAEALLALAPSTAFQMPFDGGEVMGALATVARALPAFVLDVGDDPAELAAAVDRVLDLAAGAPLDALEPNMQGVAR
jgi:hypothetical protein